MLKIYESTSSWFLCLIIEKQKSWAQRLLNWKVTGLFLSEFTTVEAKLSVSTLTFTSNTWYESRPRPRKMYRGMHTWIWFRLWELTDARNRSTGVGGGVMTGGVTESFKLKLLPYNSLWRKTITQSKMLLKPCDLIHYEQNNSSIFLLWYLVVSTHEIHDFSVSKFVFIMTVGKLEIEQDYNHITASYNLMSRQQKVSRNTTFLTT